VAKRNGRLPKPLPFPHGAAERAPSRALIPLAVLVVLAALFVLWEVALRRILPEMSIGWHHALLTVWAGVVTAITCSGVYFLLHRQNRRLSTTAEQLSRLLASYQSRSRVSSRFENPHLQDCWKVFACDREECAMHGVEGERCWHVLALQGNGKEDGTPDVTIQQCHKCRVYRLSCPDKLTELGESFNSLMTLLDDEAQKRGAMQAQLVEKEKMVAIGQMAAGVAHEVGNPLSSISSITQMLKRAHADANLVKQLDLIETHIQRISSTVRQMVSLARPGAEQWERIDVGSTLSDAVDLVAFDRRARTVNVDYIPPQSLPLTYGRRGELQQVFINLALNALDAMPNGGTLTIRAQKNRRNIVVTVKDTGLGIAHNTGRRIFEPFYTTKEPGQGTGLGLSVSYGIVRKHGGSIEFKSEVGEGTAFTVHLPILDKPPDASHE
jgi:signal transduction histidine kinase